MLMNTRVLFGLEPMDTIIRKHRVIRQGSIVTLYNGSGKAIGRITLNSSGDHRGVLWLRDALAGEFSYSRKRWRVYPIENGSLSRRVLNIDPVLYLIERFEAKRHSMAV
jgi:hypothetical protein